MRILTSAMPRCGGTGSGSRPQEQRCISFSRTGGRSRYKRVRTLVTRISGEVQVVFAPRFLGSVRRRLQATRRPLTRLMTNITRATTSSK